MGSGIIDQYGRNVSSGSQPFAPSYSVLPEMMAHDKETGVYNGEYDKNPTAINIEKAINNGVIISKYQQGSLIYVITTNDEIIIGSRNGNGREYGKKPTPHPTLIGGKNPVVKMAGMLELKNGKIYNYNCLSGHFRPNKKSIVYADAAFSKLPQSLFAKDFKRRIKNDK